MSANSCCLINCFCSPFRWMAKCCKPKVISPITQLATSVMPTPTFDPAAPYRRNIKTLHIKARSWQVVEGKMRYERPEAGEEEKRVKHLRSYKSHAIVKD